MFRVNDSTLLDPKHLWEIIFLDSLILQHQCKIVSAINIALLY